MQEKELIQKIKRLQEIKPDSSWVLRTKMRILGEQEFNIPVFWSFQWKRALVFSCLAAFFLSSVLLVKPENRAVLYSYLNSFKQIRQAKNSEQESDPRTYLIIAEEKMKELKQVVQSNDIGQLAFARQEAVEAIRKATESIPEISEDPAQTSGYVQIISSIQADKEAISELLGDEVDLGEQELKGRVMACLENSIEDTEAEKQSFVEEVALMQIRSLNQDNNLGEKEQEDLNRAEELFEKGQYDEALEVLLLIGE